MAQDRTKEGSGATEKARRGRVALQRFSTEAKTAVAIGLGASSPNNHDVNMSGSNALMQTCFFNLLHIYTRKESLLTGS